VKKGGYFANPNDQARATPMSTAETQENAFTRITAWMSSHGAEVLAENLSAGAGTAHLDEIEARFGFALPPDLRTLWTIHDGQREEMNGFFEIFDLFSAERAFAERELIALPLQWHREDPIPIDEAALSQAELASDAWIAFAGRDSDGLAVCALTGRVFTIWHDDPPPRACAESVTAWLSAYAARVEAEDYRVEEGFGDCFLELRDREKEARDAERERRAQEEVRRRAERPLLELFDEAIARDNVDLGEDVLARAERESSDAVASVIDRLFGRRSLFARPTAPEFVARVLRVRLSRLQLSAAQWKVVADGGERIGNNAVRDLALARSREAS
jgi:SMI1 / KNR4 family (SUKH-1)